MAKIFIPVGGRYYSKGQREIIIDKITITTPMSFTLSQITPPNRVLYQQKQKIGRLNTVLLKVGNTGQCDTNRQFALGPNPHINILSMSK